MKRFKVKYETQLAEILPMIGGRNIEARRVDAVWRAENNRRHTQMLNVAALEFVGTPRQCRIVKTIGSCSVIGELPYNKALKYAREHLEEEK